MLKVETNHIGAGKQILLGAPAVPMPADRSSAIARLVATVPQIVEAHLPQCYIEGQMPKPAQLLFVVFATEVVHPAIQQVGAGLHAIMPQNKFMDVWPITSSSDLLETIRGTNCQIHKSTITKSPWWRFRRPKS